jgi:hypothetical protein
VISKSTGKFLFSILTALWLVGFQANSYASDFETRCAQPGVIKCVGFDAPQEIQGQWGDNYGTSDGTSDSPAIDTSQMASGSGSLKFTAHSNTGNMGGAYFTNFSEDLSAQFGSGERFYVQFRQRFSQSFLATPFQPDAIWKQMIVGTGDKPNCESVGGAENQCSTSCTDLEVVIQNYTFEGFPHIYRTCGGSAHLRKAEPLFEDYGDYDFKLQNARPSPFCLYSQSSSSYFPPSGNCFGYFPNEWMTFQIMIEPGPRVGDEFANSKVKMWMAREGQPSELVVDFPSVYLGAGSSADDQKYGKVWFTPYLTNKSSAQSHDTAYTWYDELIISTNKIADPTDKLQAGPNAPADLVAE